MINLRKRLLSTGAALASLIGVLMSGEVIADAFEHGGRTPASAKEWFAAGQQELQGQHAAPQPLARAKNVILFIGDGMGVSTVTAARILAGQMAGRDGEYNRLSFERFPYLAHSVTASANQQTADSAPTATAMVTGAKANDGAISVAPALDRFNADAGLTQAHSLKTLLERAEQRGMSTGLVTTARVSHATPAVNYAHIANRDWECDSDLPAGATVKDIARQLLEFPYADGLEVVLGGGRSQFMPKDRNDPEYPSQQGKRRDGRDLTEEWRIKNQNADYVWNKAQFDAVDSERIDHLLGLFERSHMHYEADRPTDAAGEPSLAEMTEKAIKILRKNRKGYYLMVEAARIDHAHHAGNAYRALTDAVALSDAVKTAKQLSSDKDTLILVTADHSHVFSIAGYPSRGNPILGKTAIDGEMTKDALGLPYTTLSYANGPGWTGGMQRKVFNPATESAEAATYAGGNLRPDLNNVDTGNPNYMQEATVPMVAETHAGEDVAIYADGPGAYLLRGTLEQNVIYHLMAEVLGMSRKDGIEH